ncbi:MAG TPA: macro domain-containing protein, partial [Melioribacteraceae bacterium]|nr:macro domain-containing protein [Melioribacteraceae bacterium]
LKSAYLNSLIIAKTNNIKTIAFPSISTGIYGYPINLAANIALQTIINFIKSDNCFNKIIFVCFNDFIFNVYKNLYNKLTEE